MIRENKDKLYLELKNELKRERKFVDCDQRETAIDTLLLEMEHVDIYYICSNKALNSIRFFGKDAIIIWDINFWKYFEKYLMQVENCNRFHKNITQGIISVVSEFLSKKYQCIPEISSFLMQIPNEFGIELQSPQEYCEKVHSISQISKLFSFYHEIGHLEHYKNNDKIEACKKIILDLMGALDVIDLLSLGEWSDLGWKVVCLIKEKKGEQILEELACDVFAVINIIDYYKSYDNYDNKEDFELASDIIVALEYISTFQNMFNAINQAWDSHYIEMKFRLHAGRKDVYLYVNELAMARNGLCSLILVVVINNMLNIDKDNREKLWEIRDENHINNDEVISLFIHFTPIKISSI